MPRLINPDLARVDLRVSPDQKRAWEEVAAEDDRTLSSWLKRLADAEVARVRKRRGRVKK